MGQQLLEPPDVSGWNTGPSWFSTGAMLARMNFASQLATNQRFALRDSFRSVGGTPESVLTEALDRLMPADFDQGGMGALTDYLRSGITTWSGSDAQLLTKVPGVVHLIAGSGEYQLV
jgi:hypothetical protein